MQQLTGLGYKYYLQQVETNGYQLQLLFQEYMLSQIIAQHHGLHQQDL